MICPKCNGTMINNLCEDCDYVKPIDLEKYLNSANPKSIETTSVENNKKNKALHIVSSSLPILIGALALIKRHNKKQYK